MREVVYNLDNVSLMVDGHRVRDFGDGDAITVEQNNDNAVLHEGALGEGIFSVINKKSATITVNLLQNSLSLVKLEELANDNAVFPVTLVDMNDNKIKGAEQCMVTNVGDYVRGMEAQDVEVTIVAMRWE